MYIGLHVKYPSFLSDFNETCKLSTVFRKILKYKFSWKSVKWEPSCSMRTDGRTDRHDEAESLFAFFCKSAQKGFSSNLGFKKFTWPVTKMALLICDWWKRLIPVQILFSEVRRFAVFPYFLHTVTGDACRRWGRGHTFLTITYMLHSKWQLSVDYLLTYLISYLLTHWVT